MATGNAARILRAPGRLVASPVDLGKVYPYGGTELGLVRSVVVQPIGEAFRVESELLGDATDVLESELRFVFSCMLRGWDDDALATLFPDFYSIGGTSSRALFSAPGNAKPGASALSRSVSLLYAPLDVVNVPAVLVHNGVPDWQAGAELAFQRGTELVLPLAVECVRSVTGRTLQIGRLADLSLS